MSDAEKFIEDRDEAKKVILKLQQSNLSKVKALASAGKGIDPAVLANLKIDTFVESFLDEGAQLVYVRNLETRLRTMLDEALAAVRQQQLTEGVTPSSLILPR
jgi:hypothetical protein